MINLPNPVFHTHIAPHLDGRDAARLASTCTALRNLVDRNNYLKRRRITHFVRLSHIQELDEELRGPLTTLCYGCKEDVIHYRGEQTTTVKNALEEELLVNNFYCIDDFLSKDWVVLAEKCPYPFTLIAFPFLSTGKHSVGDMAFHRGYCIKIKLSASNKKRKI